MHATAILAGFFGAHAIWSIAEGEGLIPILGFMRDERTREMTRLEGEDLEHGVNHGRAWLAHNPDSAVRAVLVYDGVLTLPEGTRDAVLIEARDYVAGTGFHLAIPYRSVGDPQSFAVHRPVFVDLADAEATVQSMSEAFFRGVNEHRQAAPVWKKHLASV